jgi:hydroxymethylbilane synthase
MLPAPGQGALAVQGRVDDPETARYLAVLDHAASRAAVTAERAFLAGLGGGCSLPVAALGQITEGTIELQALVADATGRNILRFAGKDRLERAEALGRALAQQALSQGATTLFLVEP